MRRFIAIAYAETLEEREGKMKRKYFYFRSLFFANFSCHVPKDLVWMEFQEE